MFKNSDKIGKGFTLIELLTTMTVFSIVVTSLLGLFGSAFKEQRLSLDSAYLLSNASYITEYMSRALRMAKKDLTGSCIEQKHNYEIVADDHIKFLNDNNECQEFFLDGNILKVDKPGKAGGPHEMVPSNIAVENLKFVVLGEPQTDNQQPRVTFVLKLKYQEQELDFQSAVSQRNLDVQY